MAFDQQLGYDPEERKPTGFFSYMLDLISRGGYFSSKVLDTLSRDGLDSVGDAIMGGLAEAIDPQERLHTADILKRLYPDMNPVVRGVTGFVGDVATDPFNALSLGSLGSTRVFGRSLSKLGMGRYVAELGDATKALSGSMEEISKLTQMVHGATTEEAASLVGNLLKGKLAELPENAFAILKPGGENLADFTAKSASTLDELADIIRNGDATNAQAKAAWEIVGKHITDDPDIAVKMQKAFPEFADQALRYNDLEKVAYRTSEDLAEKRIADMMGMSIKGDVPTKNLELWDRGGIKLFGKTVIPGDKIQQVLNYTPIPKLAEQVGNIKVVQSFIGAFNRNFKLPEEFLRQRSDMESLMQGLTNDVMRNTNDIFASLVPEQRKLIGEAGTQIEQTINETAKAKADEALQAFIAANPGAPITKLTQDAAKVTLSLEEQAAIRNQILESTGLKNDKEAYAAFIKMRHGLNEIGIANMRAGLIEDLHANYFPIVYNSIKDADLFKQIRRGAIKSTSGMEPRVFSSLAEAKAAGWNPEMDAAMLYAVRALESKQAVAEKYFKDSISHTFGPLDKLPERLRKDIGFIGESKFPEGMSDGLVSAIKVYDKSLSAFKRLATAVRPAFGVRQVFSNALQSYLGIGVKSMRAYDPRSAMDAVGSIMAHYGAIPMEKWAQHELHSPIGTMHTGEQLVNAMKQFGVLRGDSFVNTSYFQEAKSAINEAMKKSSGAGAGYKEFLHGVLKYTDYPSHIEDFARASLFMNALRMGHDPRKAAGIVNSTLFDYKNGLSRFGRRIGQRVVPFLSFTNFAIPLITKIAATQPGRIANLNHVTRDFFDTLNDINGGAQLNASQRSVLPGFLLEQSKYLESLSPEGQALFRTFSNFTPLDVMGNMQVDGNGDFDARSTIEKIGASQLAPQLKMPLEWFAKKEFFTGQEFKDMTGNIGKQKAETLFSNVATALAASGTGNLAVAAGTKFGAKGIFSNDIVKDAMKKLVGWEEAVDPVSGESKVFLNPYSLYVMKSIFPPLAQAIRSSREDKEPMDNWLDLVMGVGTARTNLPQQARYKEYEFNKQIQDQKSEVYKALRQGRPNRYEEEVAKLQELLQDIAERRATMYEFPMSEEQ